MDVYDAMIEGLSKEMMSSIHSCDIDLRKELGSNIIVCGGNALLGGLCD